MILVSVLWSQTIPRSLPSRTNYLEYIAEVLGEYGGGEALLHLVVDGNALLHAGALQQVHDRGKRLSENKMNNPLLADETEKKHSYKKVS